MGGFSWRGSNAWLVASERPSSTSSSLRLAIYKNQPEGKHCWLYSTPNRMGFLEKFTRVGPENSKERKHKTLFILSLVYLRARQWRATGGDGERLPPFRKDFSAPAKHRYFLYFTRRERGSTSSGALFLRCPKAIPWINDFLISSCAQGPNRSGWHDNGRCGRRKIGTANRTKVIRLKRTTGCWKWNGKFNELTENIPEDALSTKACRSTGRTLPVGAPEENLFNYVFM